MKSKPLQLTKPEAPGLTSSRDGVTVGFLDVSPKLATVWLKHNVNNRKLREDTVNGYARDQRSGNWLMTHQGVAFNDHNELIDGQHRLEAIVRSQTTVTLMVTFGLPSKKKNGAIGAMDVVDAGAPRSIANILELQHGFKSSSLLASTAKVIGNLCYPGRLRKATVPQTLAILEVFGKEINRAMELRADLRCLGGSNVLGAAAFAMPVNPVEVEEFLRHLHTGANLMGDSPILQLRHFLISTDAKMAVNGPLSARVALAEVVLQSILLFIQNKTAHKLSVSPDGANHFRERQKGSVEKVKALFDLPAYYRNSPTGPAMPPPGEKEMAYQRLRSEMNINPKDEEEEAVRG